MILATVANTATTLNWADLGLDPVMLQLGPLKIRWYSMAYIMGIILGWWYLSKMCVQPGAPMAKRHVDDFVFYVTLGIILGGRLGYCLFYKPDIFAHPKDVFKLWEGGMSFHGGIIGVMIAVWWMARREKLNILRILDYVTVVYPVGHFFGRIANFINGELWGRPSTLPWAMTFPGAGDDLTRHPSQLYQAGLEGIGLGLILAWLFFKTPARYEPGKLMGAGAMLMGLFRFGLEFFRQPDAGVNGVLDLSMGQTLSIPMILLGGYFFFTAKGRRQRVEAISGTSSVA